MHKQATSAIRKKDRRAPTRPKSLAQEYFVSPEIFAAEQEKVFARNWLLVGHQSQIAKPGDYFLATIAVRAN
jgi:phenylpropionate dioxygenase-like ring-hydroxylating dioxygenase large terminal subunit